MKTVENITITGFGAYAIENANHASFYGINKTFGNLSETAPGRAAAHNAIEKWLGAHGIDWNSFWIISARTIDTSGTKTPYKAEIVFAYD